MTSRSCSRGMALFLCAAATAWTWAAVAVAAVQPEAGVGLPRDASAYGHFIDEFIIEGIHTTIPIHREIMRHPAFQAGQVDTTLIERTWMQSGSKAQAVAK